MLLKKTHAIAIFLFFLSVAFFESAGASSSFRSCSPGSDCEPLKARTAGIRSASYSIRWCSPHATRLNAFDSRFSSSNPCQTGAFHKVSSSYGVVTYTGTNFRYGGVGVNTSAYGAATRTGTEVFQNFFDVSTVGFQGEGEFHLTLWVEDFAGNVTGATFVYKVDKTAPQFVLQRINGVPNYTYAPGRLDGMSGFVYKNDSYSTIPSGVDQFPNPTLLLRYTGDNPALKTTYERPDLHVLYFQNSTSGLGANHSFSLQVSYDDSYSSLLLSSYIASMTGYYEVIRERDGSVVRSFSGLSTTLSFNTSLFSTMTTLNSQEKYKLRIYDNTLSRTGGRGNYSEIVFYVVRDNTPPNVGGNGLTGSRKQAVYNFLGFQNTPPEWISLWDWHASPSDPETSGAVGKFSIAHNARTIFYRLADIGITGYGTTSGNNPNYAWYNAGLPATGITIRIEQANNPSAKTGYNPLSNRFQNEGSFTHDFSQVDNDRLYGQRKYSFEFSTNPGGGGIAGAICDYVGNCLYPKLDMRVVAGPIDTSQSRVTFGVGSATGSHAYMFAGSGWYHLQVENKDQYGNAIVAVTARENESKLIKDTTMKFEFLNNLYLSQTGEYLSGEKGVILHDTQGDNTISHTGAINTGGIVFFDENNEGATLNRSGGFYSFRVYSYVPSYGGYHYLNDDSILVLRRFLSEAKQGDVTNVGMYPKDNATGALGLFSSSFSGGSSPIVAINREFISSSDPIGDFDQTKRSLYGSATNLIPSGITYSQIPSTNFSFEYASPVLYGGSGFSLSHLINNIGQTREHTKLAYRMGGVSLTDVYMYEKYLPSYQLASVTNKKYTPNIFNIMSAPRTVTGMAFENAKINRGTGKTLPLTGSTIWSEVYHVKSSPIRSNYQVQDHVFNMGYVSYVRYAVGGKTVFIPSISRNMGHTTKTRDKKYASYVYFPESVLYSSAGYSEYVGSGNYKIVADDVKSVGLRTGMGVAVTGLSSKKKIMLDDDTVARKANVNIGENITRYDQLSVFKQNVQKYGKSIPWCTGSSIINITDINQTGGSLARCTVNIQGEWVSFLRGHVNIDCGTNCILNAGMKRAIIVEDGTVFIRSNISKYGRDTARILIASVLKNQLSQFTLSSDDNPILDRRSLAGWLLVSPQVTNLDGFFVSQGPFVSFSGTATAFTGRVFNTPTETDLKNQLHIFGSVLSLNTIGGYSSLGTVRCPYIIPRSNCDQRTAFVFDMVTLRRYSLEGTGAYLFPSGGGMRSGRKTSGLRYSDTNGIIDVTEADSCSPGSDPLRCIRDKDYIVYPVFFEKDTIWNTPSIFFVK